MSAERAQMPDTNYPPGDFIGRGEFAMMDGRVRILESDMALAKANQTETKSDVASIKSGIATIQAELKTMRGWRQFLITGGIGVGWGLVQGIMHVLGWGSAP
ncbi:hypothetical protein predicted by Glimmer/Critica [Acetobacter senegalensis]|uniref:DUF1640 domain-containing protein n=1 Tax=Acetobacter senegalensis TaxID=446692 RepID=A0A0U5BAC5_9PROT|nr:hypothetical protein [Acetobacter senegalensis]CEF41298.1 hypothetical protein predicted by Glimmer/Critica [Acetobacter senegalensis]